MKLFIRRPGGLITGVISLAAVAGAVAVIAAPAASGDASAASTPACTTSGLVVWLDTNSNGALGSIFFNMMFANESGHRCTVTGYPGVSAVDLNGHQLGAAASHDSGVKKKTITLNNGQAATAELRVVETGVFSTSVCKPKMAAGFRVYPPNQRAAKYAPFAFLTCSNKSNPNLTIRVVQKSLFSVT
jgi:hypothetical protein